MKAALFIKPGLPVAIETLPDPAPGEDDLVLKVSRCGVCGTDLHLTSGEGRHFPECSQFGHEFAGEVVETGKGVRQFRIGDRVTGLPGIGCGQCEYCRTGIHMLCKSYTSHAKALAQFVRIPEQSGIRLPDDVSLADGALIEPLAVARRALRLANPAPRSRILIIGPGPIGLGLVFWLRRAGIDNIAVLASSDRRKALAMTMGAEHFITESETAAEEIRARLGSSPDIVFEAAGMPGVVARAIELIRPQGLVLALGFSLHAEPLVPAHALIKDVTLRFSITYAVEDFEASAQALVTDADRARIMVTDVVSLDAFPTAFEALRHGRTGGGKLVVDPWNSGITGA